MGKLLLPQYCSDKNLGLSDEKAEEQGERSRERGFWFSPLHPAPRSPAVLTENFVLTEQYWDETYWLSKKSYFASGIESEMEL
jgi:hypothetical protein